VRERRWVEWRRRLNYSSDIDADDLSRGNRADDGNATTDADGAVIFAIRLS